MELTGSVLYFLQALLSLCNIQLRSPPYNQAFGVIMFNATLPAREFVVSGEHFYNDELKWNATTQAAFKVKAMSYFKEKFGFENPEANSNLSTVLYSTNPLANTRCVDLVGEVNMPSVGYPLHDGGWMITVINPKGVTLGGEFPGVFAPMGTTFAIGQYLIVRYGKPDILWEFQHLAPGIVGTPDQGRISHGELQVTSKKWGTGLSLHVVRYNPNANGSVTAIYRNVITF